MSRAGGGAVAGAVISKNIWITEITKADGKKHTVMSAQWLCDQSIRVNGTWDGERWEREENQYVTTKCSNSGALFLLITLCSRNDIHHKVNTPDSALKFMQWKHILQFLFQPELFFNIANYSVALRRPSLFPLIDDRWKDATHVVEAAMCGQEDMVMNILRADPSYLLRKVKVKNSVDIEYEVMPLAAAVMANDIQMAEKMREHFARLAVDLVGNPIDGLAEFNRQIKEIYKASLQRYLSLQKIKIVALEAQQEYGLLQDQVMGHVIGREQHRYHLYREALASNNIEQIVETHNQAQENNAFDFRPYIDAILSASPAERAGAMALIIHARTPEQTAAVIARTGVGRGESDDRRSQPFNQLTLGQKTNRFREKLKEHMQQEMIFNSHHILAALKENDTPRRSTSDSQQDYYKGYIIFSWLCGEAQRLAAEPVKQDIRQGTWYLTEENEPRMRQSRFNNYDYNNAIYIRSSLVDVSLADSSVIDGLGYRFAAPTVRIWARACFVCCGCHAETAGFFSKHMSNKNKKLAELIRPRAQRF